MNRFNYWVFVKTILFLFHFATPIITYAAFQVISSAEMWWCSKCGLAYPTSQKYCLNKDCPLCKKSKSSK